MTKTRTLPEIGKHLATFNLFRENDGSLHVTVAEARGVIAELGVSGAPPILCALTALSLALGKRMTKTHTSDLEQRVNIGEFTIELRGGDFWIVHKSGEGATFPVEQFEQAVREFYNAHF